MTFTEEDLRARLRSVAQRIDRPRVVVSGNGAVPTDLLAIVDDELESYVLHSLNAPKGIPTRDGVVHETAFVGPGMRRSPALSYTPSRLSLVPQLYKHELTPDLVLVMVSAPVDGHVSLGIEVNVMPAAIEACRAAGGVVLAQVNERMPYTFGDGEMPLADLDGWIEAARDVSLTRGAPSAGEAAQTAAAIGELVTSRVKDGSTLQLGIGEVPDATLPGLSKLKSLGVWTEMFSDGLLELHRAGALDESRQVTSSFCFGSQELYDWVHRNDRVVMRRTEVINNPARIAEQPQMTSINTALQIDLFAQANASRIKTRIHSGFGGQTDFIVGALHAHGGQAIMALRSWHPKADVSTIVPLLDEPVTSMQPSAVITEQGIAEIRGYSEKSQARHLIRDAAHPRVKDELWEEAAQLGLL